MPLDLVKSERGKDMLVLDGYLYGHEKTMKSDKVIWSCYKKRHAEKCKGRVHTQGSDVNGDVISQDPHEPPHAPEPDKIEAKRRLAAMKRRAAETMDPPRRVIQQGTMGLDAGVAAALPVAETIRRTLSQVRVQARGAPAMPPNLTQLDIPQEYRQTVEGSQFLAYDSGPGPDRILIFASTSAMMLLAQSQKWFADGTFKICPTLFYQVFTVHAMVEDEVVPCVYALLPNKTQETYVRFFTALKNLPEHPVPPSVMTDFEMAVKNALKAVFPGVSLDGWFFHQSQACWHQIQGLGLQGQYTQDKDIAVACRSLPALAFVPIDDVRPLFLQVGRTFPPELEEFLIYFEKTWIGPTVGGRVRPPLHPIPEWNQYEATLNKDPRTNNKPEAWHKSFQPPSCDHP